MKLVGKPTLITIGLGVLSVALLTLLAILVQWGEHRVHAPEHLTARRLAKTDLALLSATTGEAPDVVAIRDNAVFYAHRTFYQPPAPAQSVPVPDYEFAGSMGLPQGKRVAFVRKKSDKSNRTVHVGDDLDGWRVESIETQQIVIVRDSQKLELKAAGDSSVAGLVHGTVTPYVAHSGGTRVIGGSPSSSHPVPAPTRAARTYQPPPKN